MTEQDLMEYLEGSGYPAHLVESGSAGLIARYKTFVAEVEKGYSYRLDDYRRDLDIRGVIETAGLSDQVQAEDARLEQMLIYRDLRVWESMPGNPFWDFGIPKNAGRELLRSLKSEGFEPDQE